MNPEPEAAARNLDPDPAAPDTKSNENKTDGEISEADAARAAENIRIWRSYLPEDCVQTMIEMGWHLSV